MSIYDGLLLASYSLLKGATYNTEMPNEQLQNLIFLP